MIVSSIAPCVSHTVWQPVIAKGEPLWHRPHVPEKFFFYGMNYSQVACIIYTFFPRYQVTSSGRVEWGFCCYEAYTPWPIGGGDLTHRIHLVNTILRIQRHTAELVELFKTISLSLGCPDSIYRGVDIITERG